MSTSPTQNTVLKIFNYIGGTLVFLGISYFIVDNWGSLNNFTRIFSTLGSAIAAFIIGILLLVTRKYEAASSAFFLLAALLLPVGLQVTLDVTQMPWNDESSNLFICTICLAVFLIAQYISPRTIFLLFTIIFASLFYLSIISFLLGQSNIVYRYLSNYEMIVLGFSYICLGYYLDQHHHSLVGPLYFFGILFILAESYTLGSIFFAAPYPLVGWEVIMPILILLTFILAIPLKSKSFLYLGTLFLLFYIGDIACRFINILGDLGWSLLLVGSGLLLMVIGYLVIFLHRKILR